MKRQKDKASKKNNRYILAVDDEPDIVRFIEQALSRQGLKVSTFTDPSMALKHLNTNNKDCGLILSDIRMPGMNGYELIRKAKEIDKQVKVALMTAFEIQDKEFHNLLPDMKVDGFLQKPFQTQQLNDVIEIINNNSMT